LISVGEAQSLILKEARSFGIERIALEKAFGRVLAENGRADRDYPPFNRAVMDGYAVRVQDFVRKKKYKVGQTIFAGNRPQRIIADAVKIMTGAAVPANFDAVIRREDAQQVDDQVTFSVDAISRGQNIARRGEDLKKGAKISLAGQVVDQSAVALLASLGVSRPLVQKHPKVVVITTGNEIVSLDRKPRPEQIRNSNLFAIRAMLARHGIVRTVHRHVTDDRKKISLALKNSLTSDVVIVTGGVSAGDSDFVPEILESLKVQKIFHKTAMKPGKPLWFGVRKKTCVFAMPGNPWSTQVVFRVYVDPFLRACFGLQPQPDMHLFLGSPRMKKDNLRHYFPVRVENSKLMPLSINSSGDIRAGLGSNGLGVQDRDEILAGEAVEFLPW